MASKRNQFDPGNCSGPVRINRKVVSNTDRSSGEKRKRMNRTVPDRNSGTVPKQ